MHSAPIYFSKYSKPPVHRTSILRTSRYYGLFHFCPMCISVQRKSPIKVRCTEMVTIESEKFPAQRTKHVKVRSAEQIPLHNGHKPPHYIGQDTSFVRYTGKMTQ